jgi:hypothetical protein
VPGELLHPGGQTREGLFEAAIATGRFGPAYGRLDEQLIRVDTVRDISGRNDFDFLLCRRIDGWGGRRGGASPDYGGHHPRHNQQTSRH